MSKRSGTHRNILFCVNVHLGGRGSRERAINPKNMWTDSGNEIRNQQSNKHILLTPYCVNISNSIIHAAFLFNAPLHDESHRFVNVKHIFFKCYFGAIWKGLSQYPHSVKDKCCDLGRGVWVSRWLFMQFSVPKHPPFDPGGITTCFRIIMTSMVWVINLLVFVSNHCIDA